MTGQKKRQICLSGIRPGFSLIYEEYDTEANMAQNDYKVELFKEESNEAERGVIASVFGWF